MRSFLIPQCAYEGVRVIFWSGEAVTIFLAAAVIGALMHHLSAGAAAGGLLAFLWERASQSKSPGRPLAWLFWFGFFPLKATIPSAKRRFIG